MSRATRWLLAAALAAAPSGRAGAKDGVDRDKLYKHVRESVNMPADVELELGELKASEVPGFKRASLKISRGDYSDDETIHVSEDGRFYLLGQFNDLKTFPDNARLKNIDIRNEPVRGNAEGKVMIAEYTDFQCPYCRVGYQILRDKILKDFPTQVRWYYKSFPLKSIHPWAEPAAVAVECANEQGPEPFWKMHDLLFDRQSTIKAQNADEKFSEIAKESGLDEAKFQACFDGKKTLSEVQRDQREADALGLRSTPSFLVNGHLVSGADYEGLKRIIQESLEGHHGLP